MTCGISAYQSNESRIAKRARQRILSERPWSIVNQLLIAHSIVPNQNVHELLSATFRITQGNGICHYFPSYKVAGRKRSRPIVEKEQIRGPDNTRILVFVLAIPQDDIQMSIPIDISHGNCTSYDPVSVSRKRLSREVTRSIIQEHLIFSTAQSTGFETRAQDDVDAISPVQISRGHGNHIRHGGNPDTGSILHKQRIRGPVPPIHQLVDVQNQVARVAPRQNVQVAIAVDVRHGQTGGRIGRPRHRRQDKIHGRFEAPSPIGVPGAQKKRIPRAPLSSGDGVPEDEIDVTVPVEIPGGDAAAVGPSAGEIRRVVDVELEAGRSIDARDAIDRYSIGLGKVVFVDAVGEDDVQVSVGIDVDDDGAGGAPAGGYFGGGVVDEDLAGGAVVADDDGDGCGGW